MKRIVWANKSNGQLCVTIPKNSGVKEGEIVYIEKEKVKTIVYTTIAATLFHYGHLRLLEDANELGDFHICGVLTDKAIKSYKEKSITNLKERKSIISSLRCVDLAIAQNRLDPTENLRKIYDQFNNPKIILVCGTNWKRVPGAEFVKSVGGKIVQLPFYEKLSKKNLVNNFLSPIKNLKIEKRNKKEKVVYTAGTWDLFHVGHLNILKKSRALGTKLIVGVSTDELVASYKKNFPIVPYEHRLELIKNCPYVDEVIKQNKKILGIEQLKSIGMDVLTIGDDWKGKYLEGLEWAKKQPNIDIIYLPYTKEVSSTHLKKKIKNEWKEK